MVKKAKKNLKKIKKKALGRGLGALLPRKSLKTADVSRETSHVVNKIIELDIKSITANDMQPRVIFDKDKLEELSLSIKNNGIIQPILVRPDGDQYKIIFGERRFRACKLLKFKTIPAMVETIKDDKAHVIALIENIQREGLNAIEEGKAYKKLIDEGHLTQDILAKKIGKSRSSIANLMRLLKLPQQIQRLLIEKKLSMGHLRCLLSLDIQDKQIVFANKAVNESLSVRELEDIIYNIGKEVVEKKPKVRLKKIKDDTCISTDPEIRRFVEKIQSKFYCKVMLTGSEEKGILRFDYSSKDDLHRILELLDVTEY